MFSLPSSSLIAIGASTGGTVALELLLRGLPPDVPPIVIVQHTLQGFVGPLVARLGRVCPMHVVEAMDGEALQPGVAYVAPAESHLIVERRSGQLSCVLTNGPLLQFHRPSVDVLFHSLATLPHVEVVAALLTGMGRDGAAGLLALRHAGAQTIAQDEKSSVIFGMPKEAIALGAVQHIEAIHELPQRILMCLEQRRFAVDAMVRR